MIYFDQHKPNRYKFAVNQTVNGQSYQSVWIIRQTSSLKMWIVECECGSFVLPAQQVYSKVEHALDIASSCITHGVISDGKGHWLADNRMGPLPKVKYRVRKSYKDSYEYMYGIK